MAPNREVYFRGAIRRIKFHNFMTYDDAQLEPGPNLNMILGPNGTGKSAIVCCIIVGLAGEVSLTGRGASPADFVKKHTDSGSTEIELHNDKGANYVVSRKITITGRTQFKIEHKSEWRINGKNCNKADVQTLTKSLNIKVDNLCQFLPQDSVTQFVKMNSYELLLNTLKAAGDNQLVEDHQKLIEFTRDVEEKRRAFENLKKSSEENEVNAARLETEVTQLREREKLVTQKRICIEKIYYIKYENAKSNVETAKSEFDKIEADLKEAEAQLRPFKRAVQNHAAEELKYKQSIQGSQDQVRTSMNLIQATQTDIENRKLDCQEEFAKFKSKEEQENQRESSLKLKQQQLESLENRLIDIRHVDCSKQLAQVEKEMDKTKKELHSSSRTKNDIEDRKRTILREMDKIKRDRETIQNVRDRKANLLRSRFPDAYKVYEWLSKNTHMFSKKIFAPIMCEINVKDPRYGRVVESAISRHELSSFVCQSSDDLKLFNRSVREQLGIRFNVILAPDQTVEEFDREAPNIAELQKLGVKAFLKDLIDAPEPIMRYLCGNGNFHRIPVADSCSEQELKKLLETVPKFYVGTQFYTVTRSKYDRQSIIVNDTIPDGHLLQFSFDTKRYHELNSRYEVLKEELDKNQAESRECLAREDQLKGEWQTLSGKFKELRAKHDEKTRLETIIKTTQESIERFNRDKLDIRVERQKLQKSIDKINNEIVEHLTKLVSIYLNYARLKELHMINLLMSNLAERNHRVAKHKLIDNERNLSRFQVEKKKKQKDVETLQSALTEVQKLAEEKISGFKQGKLNKTTLSKFNSISANNIDDLMSLKEDLNARTQRIYRDPNNNIMDEYNKQKEELRDRRIRMAELDESIKKIDKESEEIKEGWIPKLNEVIDVIDKHYREFMQKLCYDGRVKLAFNEAEPNNFSAYGIQIMVKYRDNEQLIPLSSTRQSGGERSVATMIYMLALQTKTTVPFRCVDEINQGMDKENERKVFELLVKTADSSSSQYFLVSPKLLSNLPYSEKMKIHIVFNGRNLGLAWSSLIAGSKPRKRCKREPQ